MFRHFSKILRALFVIVGSTVVIVGLTLLKSPVAPAGPVQTTTASPIRHVVILIQENHSFDNVLGLLCLQLTRCEGPMTRADGTPIGLTSTGPISLPKATNIVPPAPHDVQAMTTAIEGDNPVNHPTLVDPTPLPQGISLGLGAGCDSNRDALWTSPSGQAMFEPSCVPFPDGHGTYLDASGKTSPVPWVPTLMDRLDSAGPSWKLYAGDNHLSSSTGAASSGFPTNG